MSSIISLVSPLRPNGPSFKKRNFVEGLVIRSQFIICSTTGTLADHSTPYIYAGTSVYLKISNAAPTRAVY